MGQLFSRGCPGAAWGDGSPSKKILQRSKGSVSLVGCLLRVGCWPVQGNTRHLRLFHSTAVIEWSFVRDRLPWSSLVGWIPFKEVLQWESAVEPMVLQVLQMGTGYMQNKKCS